MSTANHRLYKVKTPQGHRLVQSPTVHRAIAHVAKIIITAEVVAPHEAYAMAKAGVEIEVVGQDGLSDETRATLSRHPLPGVTGGSE
jgi:hypothetical protein